MSPSGSAADADRVAAGTQASIEVVRAAYGGFLESAAREIVSRNRSRWPDLSGLLVLVPDLHCAADVARALAAAGGGGPLLLPRITTLPALAASVPIPFRITPQSVREVELYALLARRPPFADTDAWALASELVCLFDRMTLAKSPIARDPAEFTETLRAAYRAGRNRALEFEATLVHELWWAQAPQLDAAGSGGELPAIDAASACALRLAALAGRIESPVYVLAPDALHRVGRVFLDACAARVPVVVIEPAHRDGDPALDRTLDSAWPANAEVTLRDRAAALVQSCPDSALAGRVQFAAADSLEQQACTIDVAVRRALLDGCGQVGVVVLDRLVARRARALLERAGVPVVDEAGWLLSTTVAAACVGRLLDVVASRGYHRDLLDLLRSPFIFAALPGESRHAALSCIERALARNDLADGLPAMIGLFDGGGPSGDPGVGETARSLLARVESALAALEADTRKPLAQWLDALEQALVLLGAREALAADAAGIDLLDLIAVRRAELQGQRWRAGFAQWRAWFARLLEGANFRPREIRSPVVFTYLQATRLRRFDYLLLAGADAAHLPANDPPGSFFNQAVRARLDLPTRELERAEVERSLRLAITSAPQVLVTWQARLAGEPNLLSPWFARLQALHRQAYPGCALGFAMPIAESAVDAPATVPAVATPTPSAAPAPAAPPERAPKRISVSGYETLIACPYRYFAETQLGLRPSEEVSEALEKSDFGELVHAILARFHREVPEVSAAGEAAAIERLVALSNAEFARALRRNFIDRAWLARWLSSVPAYVAWQVGREADGWRVSAVEADRFLAIDTPGGRTITLVGRLDRIDSLRDDWRDSRRDDRSSGATEATLAVIDYKAQGADELKKRAAQPGEHVQLPAYALLVGEAAGETLFLSIARDEVSPCAAGGHPGPAARANRDRLARLADRLHEGAPMPANGIEKVCEYCAVSGLCRRDFWVDAQRPDAVSEPRPGDDE